MSLRTKPLRIAALGMEQRTYNTLQLFFIDHCDNQYVLSDEKSADIFIIDMDGYQASKLLENTRTNHPDQPAILISINDKHSADAVFVRKPIQLSVLSSALSEAQQLIGPTNRVKLDTVQSAKTMSNPVRTNPSKSNFNKTNTSKIDTFKTSADTNNATQLDTLELNITPSTVTSVNSATTRLTTPPIGTRAEIKTKHPDTLDKNNSKHMEKRNNSDQSVASQRVKYFINKDKLRTIQEANQKYNATNEVLEAEVTSKFKPQANPLAIAKSALEFRAGANDSGIMFLGDLDAKFNPRNPRQIAKMQYKSEITLQGYFSLAYSIAQTSQSNIVLEGPWRPIIILYESKEVTVERNFRHLYALSNMTFRKEEVSIYGQDDNSTFLLPDQVMVQPIEQFLWKLTLRTSRGRIPEGTDLHTPVKLNRWPNFTRCDATPHAFRIAALWTKQPTSLVDTAKILAIPQQYVFIFYSAARAINLITFASEHKATDIKPQLMQQNVHRNLFQNLLDRLRHFSAP